MPTHIDERYRVMLAAIADSMAELLQDDARVSWVVIIAQHENGTHHRVGVVSDLDPEDTRSLMGALAQQRGITLQMPRARKVN